MKDTLLKILNHIIRHLALKTIQTFKPFIIAITGSVGKTSAKEAIYAVLRDAKRVRRSSANLNNELGVSLTILGDWKYIKQPAFFFWLKVIIVASARLVWKPFDHYPEVLVLEYGADAAGDIKHLMSIAHPDMGVLTGIGIIPVHVENYLTGVDGVVREKSTIVSDLYTSNIACINIDDPHAPDVVKKTKARIVSYGFNKEADIRISRVSHTYEGDAIAGITFKLDVEGSSIPFVVRNVFSISHAHAIAAAVAIAHSIGINPVVVATSLERYYKPVQGRSALVEGIKRTQIIDESYNSSPAALEVALASLKMVTHRRKIAVLGDMLELGQFTIQAHERAGALVPQATDILITVGDRAKFIAQKALEKGMYKTKVFVVENAEEASRKLQAIMLPGDLILVKGSHSIGLDAVVNEMRRI